MLGMDRVEHDVDMGMGGVGMRHDQRLMVLPAHGFHEGLRRRDHLVAGNTLARMPVQADMLDRLFHSGAAGTNAGLGFQQFPILERPQHFVYRGSRIVMGKKKFGYGSTPPVRRSAPAGRN